MTKYQLMPESDEFGKITSDFLLQQLRSANRTTSKEEHARDGDDHSRRPASKFIIFYGLRTSIDYFPFISSLFRPVAPASANATASTGPAKSGTPSLLDPFPNPYLTLPDQSNYYADESISFVFCVPESSVRLLFSQTSSQLV